MLLQGISSGFFNEAANNKLLFKLLAKPTRQVDTTTVLFPGLPGQNA